MLCLPHSKTPPRIFFVWRVALLFHPGLHDRFGMNLFEDAGLRAGREEVHAETDRKPTHRQQTGCGVVQ